MPYLEEPLFKEIIKECVSLSECIYDLVISTLCMFTAHHKAMVGKSTISFDKNMVHIAFLYETLSLYIYPMEKLKGEGIYVIPME